MGWLWMLAVAAGVLALFFLGARMTGRGERVPTAADHDRDGRGGRDLGANINPSQTGNQVNLWPDRTGAQTRKELGARQAVDRSFTGDREEHKGKGILRQSAPASAYPQPGVRREVADGSVEPRGGGGQRATADLDPEDAYGEDRPAQRTTAPDQPPTQWHPREHGVPGDHMRDGHHRSATAPDRKSGATDPYAHAPVPGPSHVPPAEGTELPSDFRQQ